MTRFNAGDRVRIDIPDKDDPDHEKYHGRQGEVIEIFEDAASDVTGDERDNLLYRVEFDGDEEMDFRWRDLRPPEDT
ncbi:MULTISPECIES: hypothetical protein [Haloarcula]|uniref:hypothetical protein n=1 Tax=Haloarcula TaxID=2237 RepID=UPI0023EC4168|nr:hypothetical protein [Halomicroarcula sp. XH51]